MSDETFFWHDYETFGTDTRRDRPCQFAGVRTDLDFNIIGEPLVIYCKPSPDYLPDPSACLITGIIPQLAEEKGMCEAEFIGLIHQQMAMPGTCSLGYNSLRFDDEVTRNTLYRNFYDPYTREWQNHNSRWDLIDLVRAAKALRPDGIVWPSNEDGMTSFRLEHLTEANDIDHGTAHDALSDVHATIGIARLFRGKQPRLFNYLFNLRKKKQVLELLNKPGNPMLLHVSGMYSAEQQRLAVVLPVCEHPANSNGVIVYDLSVDPRPLLSFSVDQIRERVFTASADLPENESRIPLKTVHVNKCPVITPVSVLRAEDQKRLGLDLDVCHKHRSIILADQAVADKIAAAFSQPYQRDDNDPDLMLYSGGFFSPQDKVQMELIRSTPVAALQSLQPLFKDARLSEMWLRYRGRNYPDSLHEPEKQLWQERCRSVLSGDDKAGYRSTQTVLEEITRLLSENPENARLLNNLKDYVNSKADQFGLC